ncbi:pyridine nucleotide-disulfide oxidoreductase [Phaeovibrio sulfidiphilus]|uniref:Pyridine nucleotide-disulfide oxidoreductase n=1 Tax=Phaeovibrio sulfidiphilus TaxID=1220600 RepID=A0A8J7CQ06_9PROT|nr:pyridine nucleotide-disulfide oxidoreductase [Phaeovibrio sulfidiphilus]MBE1237697.1 pyridine nucleotide-disulfide oxidoreductase [Phaeovibrio sulfidiphilus]
MTSENNPVPGADAVPLGLGFTFADLYCDEGLARLDAAFCDHLSRQDRDLGLHYRAVRANPASLEPRKLSDLMLEAGPHLESFLAALFGIEREVGRSLRAHQDLDALYTCKRKFVQRIAVKKIREAEAQLEDPEALEIALSPLIGADLDDEMAFARAVVRWMEDEASHAEALELATHFAAWAAETPAGQARFGHGVLFRLPEKLDYDNLVETVRETDDGVVHTGCPPTHLRERDGFDLTDSGFDLPHALDAANMCIFCYRTGADSCKKGLQDRKTGEIRVNPLGREMLGCPLEEHISEMNELKSRGMSIAALAAATVANPMVAGTGHRICNDCMVSCIYQNQSREPVNIPQIETRTLKDVLDLPWGFEIYSLLTRWNPLNVSRPLPRPDTGRAVLVAGLGPAGYTLAHHLLNEGHTVVGIDGLKIEPLDPALSGVKADGTRVPFSPIRDWRDLYEPLGSRVMGGFGGVAEYGITVRWDKNYLTVIRLLLERRARFSMLGGVRMGGTLTLDEAFSMGFDHVALCLGAGRPTIVPMENGLARGVRQASDFLMGLQLTGASRSDSIANLQVRLPVAVIGGGLTAIDACTEALAYYPVQVEKFLSRYEQLVSERGEAAVRAGWSAEEREVAEEFLVHGRAIRRERAIARRQGRAPRLREMLKAWGGAAIFYRRRLVDSPAYRNNYEEVIKAFEEGITFCETLSPAKIELDEFGHAAALHLTQNKAVQGRPEKCLVVPVRTVIIAAGTVPNTVLGREDETARIPLDGKYFQAVDMDGNPVSPEHSTKPDRADVLLRVNADGTAVSFFGDQHPSFAGNVVSAMSSAQRGYPVISRMLEKLPEPKGRGGDLIRIVNEEFRARVHEVRRFTDNIVQLTVHAPAQARRFEPGQFFRLQNFERFSTSVDNTTLAMEGVALTGASVDRERGLLSMIVLEMGGSSDLVAHLKPGDPVVVMGPTGAPTFLPSEETVLLVGGGLGNAVLFSIGRALRDRGNKVLYFAGYKGLNDRYRVDDIHAAADVVVWCCDEAPGFTPSRPRDLSFVGNIVEALRAYGAGEIGEASLPLPSVDRMLVIGSDRMMSAVGAARHSILKPYLKASHHALGSINSPMQCMMKEICGQCLQPQRDPATGEVRIVFTCFNQDQPLDAVDFTALAERLGQNSLPEKLTRQWLDRCLVKLGKRETPRTVR